MFLIHKQYDFDDEFKWLLIILLNLFILNQYQKS